MCLIFNLVFFSALFSGLTIGLYSIDIDSLRRKKRLNNKYAAKVYLIRKNGNLLLSSLMLGNVIINSVISIYLKNFSSGIIAASLASTLIFIFGEILPAAICTKYSMRIGAKTYWLVIILIVITYPISKPISIFLDKTIGKDLPRKFSRNELKELIKDNEDNGELDKGDEKRLLNTIMLKDIMTPRIEVFLLDSERKVNQDLLEEIKRKGFTRYRN